MSKFYRSLEVARTFAPSFDVAFEIAFDFASKVEPAPCVDFQHAAFLKMFAVPSFPRVFAFARKHLGARDALVFARSFAPVFEEKEAKANRIASTKIV